MRKKETLSIGMFCLSRLTCGKGQRFTVVTIESWSVDNLTLLHVMVNRCEKAEFHDGIEAVVKNSCEL